MIMTKLDTDGDGTISLEEFIKAFKWTDVSPTVQHCIVWLKTSVGCS